MRISENVSLKAFNTFGVDVSANFFVEINSIENIQSVLEDNTLYQQRKLILGGGSNILLTKDFNGLVIKNDIRGRELIREDDSHYYLKVGAGENWHVLVQFCIDKGYAGIENLSLIPGKVGAAPMQNIGAYGVELKDVFHQLEAVMIDSGEIRSFTNQECKFGYRSSVFKTALKGKCIITSVTLKLDKNPKLNISYGAIEQELERMKVKEISIKAIGDAVCSIRRSKLPDPEKIGNAGSFFKNPVIENAHLERLRQKHPKVPSYPDKKGVKVPAGWLIETAGWKGKSFGNFGVHENQALVLVNFGGAKGGEICQLSQDIVNDIKIKFDIELEREVNIL